MEVDVDELNPEQLLDLNKMATPYGMGEGDFVRYIFICSPFVTLTPRSHKERQYKTNEKKNILK